MWLNENIKEIRECTQHDVYNSIEASDNRMYIRIHTAKNSSSDISKTIFMEYIHGNKDFTCNKYFSQVYETDYIRFVWDSVDKNR